MNKQTGYYSLLYGTMFIPGYAGLFLMVAYPQFAIPILGLCFSVPVAGEIIRREIKNSKYLGKRAIGLTKRLKGGRNELVYIVFESYDLIHTKEDGTTTIFVIDKITGDKHILTFPHPFESLAFQEEDIFVGLVGSARIPTTYVEGAVLRTVKLPVTDMREPGLWDRVKSALGFGSPASDIQEEAPFDLNAEEGLVEYSQVDQVFVYGTNTTALSILMHPNIMPEPPTSGELTAIYQNFTMIDPQYSTLIMDNHGLKLVNESAKQVIKSCSSATVEYKKPVLKEVEDEGGATGGSLMRWALIGVGAFLSVLGVIYLAPYVLNLLGWGA